VPTTLLYSTHLTHCSRPIFLVGGFLGCGELSRDPEYTSRASTHTFFFFFSLHHTSNHFSTVDRCGDFARVYLRSRSARLASHHLVITIDQRPEQYTWHRRFLYVRKELQELKAEVKTNSPAMSLSHVDKHHYGNRLNSADPLFLYYIHYPPIFVLSLQILFNTHLT
jgi:hypothetical protein